MNHTEGKNISIHGHRGCRGLLPENIIPAFVYALELGVDALELDVVLTGSGDILVSHDPFMSHEICLHPDGLPISKVEEMSLNIFQMSTIEAQTFRCGTIAHQRFPDQKLIAGNKPTLTGLVAFIKDFCLRNDLKIPLWNIEIKSHTDWDNIFHPSPKDYVAQFLAQFDGLDIRESVIIQCFDSRVLEELHKQAPTLKLVLLTDNLTKADEEILAGLSFRPYGYSPTYTRINESTVIYCRDHDIVLLAWTVNEESDILKMIDVGVLHIITDHPDRAMRICAEQKEKVARN